MSAIGAFTEWLVAAFGMASAIVRHALRPLTWRRPARDEFWRFMDIVCVGNLTTVLVTASLVGLAVVSQALYWLERFGQSDAIGQVVIVVMVREVGPLIVGLLVLGSGGILLLGELSAMRSRGQLDALDRQGIDPFLLLVVPRVTALIAAVFAHSVLFVFVAFVTGYVIAQSVGATAVAPSQFLARILDGIGSAGYLIVPAKSLAIGLTIGVICSLTAIDPRAEGTANERLTAAGFLRAIPGVLLVSAVLSVAL